MRPRRSPRQIVTWTIILTAMAATLTVLWNVVIVQDHFRIKELAATAAKGQEIGFRWFVFPLGVIFLVAICIGLLMLGVKLVREVDFSQKQSNFIAGVTHEFKSPLAAIRLSVETVITRDMSAADRQRFLEGVLEDVDRLSRLVDNVLAAGKIDLHRLDLHRVHQDLNAFLRQYHAERQRALAIHKVSWTLDLQGEAPIVMDTVAMRIALDNLIENAIKYTEGPREITLEGRAEGGAAVLRVRDKGIGVHPDDARAVFDRFQRGQHQPRRRVPGTGLGLFLVENIVRGHGGTVRLISAGVGKGTTAEIRIPLHRPEAQAAEVAA